LIKSSYAAVAANDSSAGIVPNIFRMKNNRLQKISCMWQRRFGRQVDKICQWQAAAALYECAALMRHRIHPAVQASRDHAG
jgi:hypothetical protein